MLSDLDIYLTKNKISRVCFFNNEIQHIYDEFKHLIETEYIKYKNNKKIHFFDRSDVFDKRICLQIKTDCYNKLKNISIATQKTQSIILRNIVKQKLSIFQNEIDDFCIFNNIKYISSDRYNKNNRYEKDFHIKLSDSNYNNIRKIKLCYKDPNNLIISNILNYQIDNIDKITSGNLDYKFSHVVEKLNHQCRINYSKFYLLIDKLNTLCNNNISTKCGNKYSYRKIINIILSDYFINNNFMQIYYETNKRK